MQGHRRRLRARGLRADRRRDRRDARHVYARANTISRASPSASWRSRASSTARRSRPGDVVLGLASDGAHSNGYSLIRKIIATRGARPRRSELGRAARSPICVLAPTRIYVKPVLELLQRVHGQGPRAHHRRRPRRERAARACPTSLTARIDRSAWPLPPLFAWLQARRATSPDDEMFRVFNCGIGMVLVVGADDAEARRERAAARAARPCRIGIGARRLEPQTRSRDARTTIARVSRPSSMTR